ncbi:MAG: hypothetical protein CMJ18_20990 [Phycisphaeraceae bacterium]|nr:hypothetical protein [Phycisphaeraceae bacterium]
MNARTFIASIIVLLAAAAAPATIIIQPPDANVVPNEPPLGPGFVTQDLVVDTDTAWFGAQLIVTLDQPDQIYRDAQGQATGQSPDPAFFVVFPTLEFDTYMSTGTLGEAVSIIGGANDLTGNPGIPGPSDINGDGIVGMNDMYILIQNFLMTVPPGTDGDIDGDGTVTATDLAIFRIDWDDPGAFDATSINAAWIRSGVGGTGPLSLARVTLADTAQGTWEFLVMAEDQGGLVRANLGGPVVDGVMRIPEPTSLTLFVLIVLFVAIASRHRPASWKPIESRIQGARS